MSSVFLVVQPDGRVDLLPWPTDEDEQLLAMQEAVGGWVERMAEAFHILDVHTVWINEDGNGRLPPNPRAHALIGMDAEYAPLCGPVHHAYAPQPEQSCRARPPVPLLWDLGRCGPGSGECCRRRDRSADRRYAFLGSLVSLSTIARPFASYSFGEGVTKGGRTSGQASGFLYRTEDGRVCLVSRTPVMAAPAFDYFPTLLAAWGAYARGRNSQVGSEAADRLMAFRIARLRAELARLEQL